MLKIDQDLTTVSLLIDTKHFFSCCDYLRDADGLSLNHFDGLYVKAIIAKVCLSDFFRSNLALWLLELNADLRGVVPIWLLKVPNFDVEL